MAENASTSQPTEGELAGQRFEESDAANPTPTRLLAEKLLRTGKVTDETTFAEMPGIIAAEMAAEQ